MTEEVDDSFTRTVETDGILYDDYAGALNSPEYRSDVALDSVHFLCPVAP